MMGEMQGKREADLYNLYCDCYLLYLWIGRVKNAKKTARHRRSCGQFISISTISAAIAAEARVASTLSTVAVFCPQSLRKIA